MNLSPRLLILPFILLLISTQTHAFNYNGNMVQDLQTNDAATFADDALYWNGTVYNPSSIGTSTGTPLNQPLFTTCGTNYLIGGSSLFTLDSSFRRKYKNIPVHEIIYYSIDVTFMDQWTPLSNLILLFDQDSHAAGVFLFDYLSDFPGDVCGDGDNDLPGVRLYGKALHDDKSLRLAIAGVSHDFTSKSFGFRNIRLHFRNKTHEEEDNFMCAFTSVTPNPFASTHHECCDIKEYRDENGVCQPCDDLCLECLGPHPSQCLACTEDAFFNGTQCVVCDSSCQTCSGPSDTDCTSCFNGEFFFAGSSCLDACEYPLIPGTIPLPTPTPLICDFSCPDNKFLTSDQDCWDTCPDVYNGFIAYDKKFCFHHCPAGKFYVPATATASSYCATGACPTGYFQENTPRYCHSCADPWCEICPGNSGGTCQACKTGAILDSDGVCKECSSMSFTYLKATNAGHQYQMNFSPSSCSLNPTVISQSLAGTPAAIAAYPPFTFQAAKDGGLYLLDVAFDGSVLDSGKMDVTLDYLTGELDVPKKLIPSPALETIEAIAGPAQTVVTTMLGASFAGTMAVGATASLWSIISFQQFIGYFKYMNIEFPYQLKIMFDFLSSASWDFLPNPIESLTKSISKGVTKDDDSLTPLYQPPTRFADDEFTSFFIDNAGGIFLTNTLLLLLMVLVNSLRKTNRFKRSSILKTIKGYLEYNIILRTLLENGIPMMLAVFLQLRVLAFTHVYLVFCALMTFFCFGYFIVMMTFIIKALRSRSQAQLEKESASKMIGTLYEGIALKEPESKYYHVVILFRGVLLVTLLVFLENIPMLQIAMLIPYNIGLVYYLFKGTAFEDKYLDKINRLKEILITIGECCILCLNFKNPSEAYYDALGWIILSCFLSALLIELVYIIALQIYNLRLIKKKIIACYNTISRWCKNFRARKRHTRQRVRRIHPTNVRLELSAINAYDLSTEATHIAKFRDHNRIPKFGTAESGLYQSQEMSMNGSLGGL